MREIRRRMTIAGLAATVLLPLALLAGCGDDGLEKAREELARIETRVERAREAFEQRRREVDRAESALQQARRDLEKAEQQLAEARADIAERADDALLFREVQGRLLEHEDLEEVAISARVDDRVVTLEGSVPSESEKRLAGEIAREVAGVESVVNRIEIDVATPPAK